MMSSFHELLCTVPRPAAIGQRPYKVRDSLVAGPGSREVVCGWGVPEPMKREHRIIPEVKAEPAVYRMEFTHDFRSAWYVGETRSFRGRVCDYAVMIRRLLAMLDTPLPVVIDKDLFRVVQYEFARSMVAGVPVRWRWRYLAGEGGKPPDTKAAECDEINAAKLELPDWRILNYRHAEDAWAYFDTMPAARVDSVWLGVHARLGPHSNRRRLRLPPFSV